MPGTHKKQADDAIRYRKAASPKAASAPASLDEAARSIELVIATETDEVFTYDWELGIRGQFFL